MDNYRKYYLRRYYYLFRLHLVNKNWATRGRPAKRQMKKKMWVRDIFLQRKAQGAFHNLLKEMRLTDKNKYFNYLRMTPTQFDLLLHKIGPSISKNDFRRETISPAERLSLTLRYLASGDSMVSVSYSFRIGPTTVSNIISETCEAIWTNLKDNILKVPTEENWNKISQGFFQNWNMPNCVGALDGKHVIIQVGAYFCTSKMQNSSL